MDDKEQEKDERKIERRINIAVTLESINGRLGRIEEKQDNCEKYRRAIDKRIEQVDLQLNTLQTRQNGLIKGIWLMGIGFIGLLSKMFYKILHG